MKQNSSYVLKRIAGAPYLLPVGQLIADQRAGVRINETGAYIWNLLKKERSLDELSAMCAARYEADAKDLPFLENDVREFVTQLLEQGILISPHASGDEDVCHHITIAGLTCAFHGSPHAFPSEFNAFASDNPGLTEPEQNIFIREYAPSVSAKGKLIIKNADLFVMDCAGRYILFFPSYSHIEEAHLDKDASTCVFYCKEPYNINFRTELFQAMQFPFFYLFQKHHMAVIHSSSILYRGMAWLFAASSGTGKSTHAGLWHDFMQTPVLNGDLNLLSVEDGKALIHGIPWCGSSGISDTRTYPLGGITLLRRGSSDFVEQLPEDRKRLLVLQRIISPSWNERLYDISFDLADSIADRVLICRLHCTPAVTAVEAMKNEIDCFLRQVWPNEPHTEPDSRGQTV